MRFGLTSPGKTVAADEINVLIAVPVIVENQNAVAGRFQNVIFFHAACICDGSNSGGFRLIDKLEGRRKGAIYRAHGRNELRPYKAHKH